MDALTLEGFGVSLGGRAILAEIDLALPRQGMTVLVGPSGCGKSTFLRTLAGLNDPHPSLATWGELRLAERQVPSDGRRHVLPELGRPRLVLQHARFFLDTVRENLVSVMPNRATLDHAAQTRHVTACLESYGMAALVAHLERDAVSLPLWQQRTLAIARALAGAPAILLTDEPTAGLDDRDAAEVISTLRAQALERSVVFVTHNQRHAQAAGGTTVLMAGGRVQETSPTAEFFSRPRTAEGADFVRSGGCLVASPDVPEEQLDSTATSRPLPATALLSRRNASPSPRGFFWVQPGRLGGLPRPGIIDTVENDLAGLQRLGVTALVTLEERVTVDPAELERHGIAHLHAPIVDMKVPTTAEAANLCRLVNEQLDAGRVIAFHCRAGLGRTGTMLACQLIWFGASAAAALEAVRAINPRCVQSDEQVAFLPSFEASLHARTPAPSNPLSIV